MSLEESLRFKRSVLDSLKDLGSRLESAVPLVPSGRSLSFLLGTYGIVLGTTAMIELSPEVRLALAADPS